MPQTNILSTGQKNKNELQYLPTEGFIEFNHNIQINPHMNQINLLRHTLKQHLPCHGARLNFLALFLIALIRVGTVDGSTRSIMLNTSDASFCC